MINRALVTAAWLSCAIVFASFALFVNTQLAAGSAHQQAELAATQTTPAPAPSHPKPVGQPKRFILGAARELESPFASIVHSDNAWVTHGVPALLALLAYGLGLGYLARFTSGMV